MSFEFNPLTGLLDIAGSGSSSPFTGGDVGGASYSPSVASLGSELITNGTFTGSLAGWTVGAGWSFSSNTALHTAGSTAALSQNISVTNGEIYLIQYQVLTPTAGQTTITINGQQVTTYNTIEFDVAATVYGTWAANTTGSVSFAITPTTDFNGAFDNVSVKQVTPNAVGILNFKDSSATTYARVAGDATNRNLAIGLDSLKKNVSGQYNVGFGSYALSNNVTGYNNAAFGSFALANNGAGYSNTAIGALALEANTSGFINIAVGDQALGSNTAGAYNTAIGVAAMFENRTGISNVAIGVNALSSNETGNYSIAIGSNALNASTAGQNVAIGIDSMPVTTTGIYNVAIGQYSLFKNTIGINNIAIGIQAMYDNIDGDENTALGSQALNQNISANNNTAIGRQALGYHTTGNDNTVVGYQAGVTEILANRDILGSQNVWIGSESGPGNTSTLVNSIGVGYRAHPTASNMAHWGNSSITENRMWGNYILTNGYGLFENVGINETPTLKLCITEPDTSAIALRVIRDGDSSVYPAAIQVQNTSGSAFSGALVENGGPNEFGVLRMGGTRVSDGDYLGVFEFQDISGGGDYRTALIVGKAGSATNTGSVEFLTRNSIGFNTAMFLSEDATVRIGDSTAGTAMLHLAPGISTRAPLKLTSGTDLSTTEDGALEYDGNRLAFTLASTARRRIPMSDDTIPSNGQILVGNGVDFTTTNIIAGTNITITNGAGTITIDAAGGGGGGGNSVTASCDFGASFTDKAQTVVSGQSWVTSTSEIVAQVLTPSGTDPDEMRLLDFDVVISDIIAGTGFTVTLYSEPEAKGNYDVMCIGV